MVDIVLGLLGLLERPHEQDGPRKQAGPREWAARLEQAGPLEWAARREQAGPREWAAWCVAHVGARLGLGSATHWASVVLGVTWFGLWPWMARLGSW